MHKMMLKYPSMRDNKPGVGDFMASKDLARLPPVANDDRGKCISQSLTIEPRIMRQRSEATEMPVGGSRVNFGRKKFENITKSDIESVLKHEVIDWEKAPNDPIFQLTFPQFGMLSQSVVDDMEGLIAAKASRRTIRDTSTVRQSSFFPSESQYCHAYCTYCFRWAQFVGSEDLHFASNDAEKLVKYLHSQPDVTDLLLTGGDPMVLNSKQLGRYLDAAASVPHLISIRIGSKSLSYWPYKFVTDDDADDMLRLLERTVAKSDSTSTVNGNPNPQAGTADQARQRRRRSVDEHVARAGAAGPGAILHVCRARHWAAELLWVPLVRALDIYNRAIAANSGLAHTARGPSMSATPGKVHILGDANVGSERVLVLKFLQGRNPEWVGRPFFAKYSETAEWLDDLEPAFGEEKFFWDDELASMEGVGASSGQLFPRKARNE
eukprot:IDg10451t1